MIRNLISAFMVTVIALVGGAWLTNATLLGMDHFGQVKIGIWTANPLYGTPLSDPYAKARLARDASLSLGAAEGITFFADSDSNGKVLNGNCDYALTGPTLTARFWTLVPLDGEKRATLNVREGLPVSLSSVGLTYETSQRFRIEISPYAKPGNWLPVPKGQRYVLGLNLYDSPMATNKGLVVTEMPAIEQVRCHG